MREQHDIRARCEKKIDEMRTVRRENEDTLRDIAHAYNKNRT